VQGSGLGRGFGGRVPEEIHFQNIFVPIPHPTPKPLDPETYPLIPKPSIPKERERVSERERERTYPAWRRVPRDRERGSEREREKRCVCVCVSERESGPAGRGAELREHHRDREVRGREHLPRITGYGKPVKGNRL